jgi:hypothetical protein
LKIPRADAIKIPPYSKYMKDIVNNKRKIPNEAITTMLGDYSFKGKLPEKRGDLGIPTVPCTIYTIILELVVGHTTCLVKEIGNIRSFNLHPSHVPV